MSDLAIALPARAPAAGRAGAPTALTGRALGLLSDARLAQLAADGAGEQAFTAIYARYHQPLYRYCHSIVRDPDDAADALQAALLKAYLALPAKKADAALKPWLYRIVHNEAISVIRRRTRHDEITDANAPQAPAADETAASRDRLAELVDDLQHLDERQRAALVMRELNGLEYEEIAAAFGTSAAAAKQTVYEARIALHERAEGRALSCEPVRRALSAGDRRKLRGRKLRAHLHACAECRRFETGIAERRSDLAALSPMLPAPAAAGLLSSIVGGSAGAGQIGLGSVLGAATANVVAAKALLAAAAVATGAFAIGAAVDHHPAAMPDGTRAAIPAPAPVRQAPPLTSIYVLSVANRPSAHLRRPAQLLASAPSSNGAGGRPARAARPGPDAASGPLGLRDAPLTVSQGSLQAQPQQPGAGTAPAPAPYAPAPTVQIPQVQVPQVALPPVQTPVVHVPQVPLPELPAPSAEPPRLPPLPTPHLPPLPLPK